MEKDIPKRKEIRLSHFDYGTPGAYFITICTNNRKILFDTVLRTDLTKGEEHVIAGADSISARSVAARIIEKNFLETLGQYEGIESPILVIMPNHFHAIITISQNGRFLREDIESSPTISQIVQSFKRHSTVEYSKMVKKGVLPPYENQLWQRSYYDHVIRNDADYEEIYRYIYENPIRWQDDELYSNGNKNG